MVDNDSKVHAADIEQDDDLPPRPTKLGDAASKEVFGGKAENVDYMINLGNDDAINAMEEG